jgi:hypothetical protein
VRYQIDPVGEHLNSIVGQFLLSRHKALIDRAASFSANSFWVYGNASCNRQRCKDLEALSQRRSVEKPSDSNYGHQGDAQRAWLTGRVEVCSREFDALKPTTSVPNGFDLTVGSRIESGSSLIEAFADHSPITQNNRPERFTTGSREGMPGQFNGAAHRGFVVL